MSRDPELDQMIDRATAELVTHPNEATVNQAMEAFWDREVERGIPRAMLDALAYVGFATLTLERLMGRPESGGTP